MAENTEEALVNRGVDYWLEEVAKLQSWLDEIPQSLDQVEAGTYMGLEYADLSYDDLQELADYYEIEVELDYKHRYGVEVEISANNRIYTIHFYSRPRKWAYVD